MAFLDRLKSWWATPAPAPIPVIEGEVMMDLPLRRAASSELADTNGQALTASREAALSLPFGIGLDADDHLYRRLTGEAKQHRRDLSPLAQDKAIEIAYFLWEQNCFARRLVTLMTDLILGEGISVEAADSRNQDVVNDTWNHRVNQLTTRVRQFYNSLSVNGELAIPVAKNPIDGIPMLGFIDPYQILDIRTVPDNILVPDIMILKPNRGEAQGKELKIVRENPETGKLEGEVFFFTINNLPNGLRGRSDLLPLADWLDLYDQFMFGEVERLVLLSTFVFDHKIEGADEKVVAEKSKKLPKFKPGSVFSHNEKETLTAVTPDLKAADRSEVARLLRVHIAGSMGYPVSYLGDIDSNKATIEGQNDITLKTPAARQKEFAGLIDQVLRYAIEGAQGANRSLFRDVQQGYKIVMPEISAKDISRVGQVIAGVLSGLDTALANHTMSRKAAVQVLAAIIAHLGIKLDPQEILDDADADAAEALDRADELQATLAAQRATGGGRPTNPPIPDDGPPATAAKESLLDDQELDRIRLTIDRILAGRSHPAGTTSGPITRN